MYLSMLKVLSFLNQIPYRTFGDFIAQSKRFKTKPAHFDELTQIVIEGTYHNLTPLRQVVEQVFNEFESLFEELGLELYDDNIDPNK